MNKTSELRQRLLASEMLIIPGAYDTLSAKIIQDTGYHAVFMTGYGASVSRLGEPDSGILSMTEMVQQARSMAQAVSIPVLADADGGYGGPLNVRRTVQEYEAAGIAALMLDDRDYPEIAGSAQERGIISSEQMVRKIKAAVAARRDPDFLIVAMSCAGSGLGLEEAFRRLRSYRAAGADVVMADGMSDSRELQALADLFPSTPIIAHVPEGGPISGPTKGALGRLGFAAAIYSNGPLFAAAKAVKRYLETLDLKGAPRIAAASPADIPAALALHLAEQIGEEGAKETLAAKAGQEQSLVDLKASIQDALAKGEEREPLRF
ncbi:MAG: isocitrate lyase/PEP mutase family protein [Pseudomonadota bacterium]